jgi:CRISPR-associated protein Csx14
MSLGRIDTMFREILIFVAGTTPQIISETVCALACKKPPVYPNEIYVVTTSHGRRCIEETLIRKNILAEFAREYNIPEVKLSEGTFVMARTDEGEIIDDIRTEKENEIFGDLITSLVREQAGDLKARLHCSLAGGRKTMSFYLGSALQLFGRPWDKLYHVLVSPEFESNPDFFYKPRRNRVITGKSAAGKVIELNTRNAEICLAELPFIRLGGRTTLSGKSFSELVAEGQAEIDTASLQPFLDVNFRQRTVRIGGDSVEFSPVHLMVYAGFLRRKTDHCRCPEKPYCLDCTECFVTLPDLSGKQALDEMAKDYKSLYGEQPFKDRELISKWPEGMGQEALRQYITKINGMLKRHLTASSLPHLLISSIKQYGNTRYGVRIDKGKIRFG